MSAQEPWAYGPDCNLCGCSTVQTTMIIVGVARNLPHRCQTTHPNKNIKIEVNYCVNLNCSENTPHPI